MFNMKIFLIIILSVTIHYASCGISQPLDLVEAFQNLTFTRPVFLTHSNDGTNRIFVVEQRGVIKVFPNDSKLIQAAN
jgi:hypothetical protein